MEAVDPLAVQIGERVPVLGQGPRHLGSRGRLRIDGPAADNLTHNRIEGATVDRLLAATGVTQRRLRQIGQPKRVIECAHHQQTAIRTDLRTPERQLDPAVNIDPINPIRTRTLWVTHETCPSQSSTQ